MANLTAELESSRKEICAAAKSEGLDFFETIFELVNYDEINQIAAFGGFPIRYPHWRWGMEYEQLSKSYEYGLSKIYELVINNDPCIAYLMEGNELIDQRLVMAHVYGHCDFFKNNQWFSPTNRKMVDAMANHAAKIRSFSDRFGQDHVEDFIDKCLSLENLIDRYAPYVTPGSNNLSAPPIVPAAGPDDGRLKVHRSYMDRYINPPELLKQHQDAQRELASQQQSRFPAQPERDVLKFLMNFAPLESWQQEIIGIIRDEAYYFAPQGMTKIMNEGWASYWHSKLMTEKIMNDSEVIDFADRHSGTMAMSPTSFNPYKVGIELFRHIEERWNRGQFGKDWQDCDDLAAKKNWDTKAGLGRDKIFEVRRNYNDVTFIDEFLTEEFCVQNKMFVYKFNRRTQKYDVDTRDFKAIKAQLLFQLTNFGQPTIRVFDANYLNRGELLLAHNFEGIELQPDYMSATLSNVYSVWKRPVHLATVVDEESKLVSFDGGGYTTQDISELPLGKR